MKLLHLADLHLGKRVHGFPMLEDQAAVLSRILEITRQEQPQAVLIAGDVYDKAIPSAEAVSLFDGFLREITAVCPQILIISGNHDSVERLSFAASLLERTGVHIAHSFTGQVESVSLTDEHGIVDFYLLPFVKPVQVRPYFPEVEGYSDAVGRILAEIPKETGHRRVLMTHQFVTGGETCESEELSVGGSEQVDAALFRDFDYVALGHLHGPQRVGSDRIRYCGSPLKYSFSEEHHRKSVTLVELGEPGCTEIRTIPLEPLRDLQTLRGTYLELTALSFYRELNRENYFRVILTDEQDIPEAFGRLRTVYPNIMRLEYDNTRTRSSGRVEALPELEQKNPQELFELFYAQQNGSPMSQQQRTYIRELIDELWEEQP